MTSNAQTDYTRKAARYIEGILSGRIPACRFVRLACERQKRDLAQSKTGKWRYIFSRQAANRVCRFIECLQHVKGPKAGEPIHLEPWQVFFLTTLFGWLDKTTGKRRFRKAYLEVPRGNGKSTLLSGIGLYMETADGEKGADIYSFATTKEQARIVFADALAMTRGNKDFREAFGVTALNHSIVVIGTNSKFLAKSSDAETLDGLNVHCGIIDELHAHKTRYVFDVVESAITKRDQPLIVSITTAGFILDGICMEQRRTIAHILDQTITDDSYFGIIYTIDPEDDWQTEEALRKANPNWGVSVHPDTAISAQKNAKINTTAQKNFLTKYLDIWVNSDSAWMDMVRYRKCISPEIKREDFRGKYCIFSVDLASKLDISAIVRLCWKPHPDTGEMHYYFFADYYLPEAAINASDNPAYDGWRRAGYLHATGGDVTDLNALEDVIRKAVPEYETLSVAYDPMQATQLSQNLLQEGAPMTELPQTLKNFSEPMKLLQALIYAGRVHIEDNPVTHWMMSNVVCHIDAKENIYPRKEKKENKIDGAVAMIMAVNQVIQLDVENAYNDDAASSAAIDWSAFRL